MKCDSYKNRHSDAIFLDIEKTLENVWRTGPYYKLIYHKLPDIYFRLARSSFTDRSVVVICENGVSIPRPIKGGISQGNDISPLLFLLYVNAIPRKDDVALHAGHFAIL